MTSIGSTHGRFLPLGDGVVIIDDARVSALAGFRAAPTPVPAMRAAAADGDQLELGHAWRRVRLPR